MTEEVKSTRYSGPCPRCKKKMHWQRGVGWIHTEFFLAHPVGYTTYKDSSTCDYRGSPLTRAIKEYMDGKLQVNDVNSALFIHDAYLKPCKLQYPIDRIMVCEDDVFVLWSSEPSVNFKVVIGTKNSAISSLATENVREDDPDVAVEKFMASQAHEYASNIQKGNLKH